MEEWSKTQQWSGAILQEWRKTLVTLAKPVPVAALWGIGLDRLDADSVGSNPA
jgi:hypothetical protein